MDWNNTFKNTKEMEIKTIMDMSLIPCVEPMEVGLGSSDKGNVGPLLKPRKKSMTSFYLKFFETASDGKSRRCKFCKQNYSIATATGNLGRHLNHRHPGYDRQGDTGPQVLQGAATSKKPQIPVKSAIVDFDNLNWLLLKCLIGASLAPSVFEDEALLNTFKYLNPSVKFWPKEKVAAVTLDVFKSMREDVRTSLEHVASKFSITLDFWTSFEQLFYMSVKCHWIDENWSMHKILLEVCHIAYPCTGPEIYHALMKVLGTFHIETKILSCTNDNSQHAIHACHALKEELDSRKVPFCYIPCAARTLNLIIGDGLRTPKPILSKIREFALELNSRPEVAQDFKQLTAIYQEGSWKPPFDTSATWNGDYTMLDIVRKVHPVLMLIGFVILNGEALLAYKTMSGTRNFRKTVHLTIQLFAFCLGLIGIWAAIKFHNDKGIDNFYSLHSWLGLACLILFGIQWGAGFVTFWYPGGSKIRRSSLLPWHVFLGVYIYALSVATTTTGILEKVTFLQTNNVISRYSTEAMLVNFLGLLLVVLGGTVVLAVVSPNAKVDTIKGSLE